MAGIAALHGTLAGGRPAAARLLVALATGTLAASWFWVPIAGATGQLRIGEHLGLLDGGIDWPALLSPVFRPSEELRGWAPQVGAHFVAAAAVVLWAGPRRAPVAWLCALGLLGALAAIVYGPATP